MYRNSGVYAGKHIWVSSFLEGRFEDQEISHESVPNYDLNYVTSDRESIKGNSPKEMALAYYAYSFIKDKRKKQEKVYEILCDDDKVELFVLDGFEQRHLIEVLHQTEYLAPDESEKIVAAKFIIERFSEKYPNVEELETVRDKIEEYEYNIINGDTQEDQSTKDLIENLYRQIDIYNKSTCIELLGYQCIVGRERYVESVLAELSDNYLALVQKLLGHINNNFEKDDVVFLFIKDALDTPETRYHLDQIAKNNCVEIIAKGYSDKFVSRGNAYYNYLVNYIQLNRIRENVGRYTVIFEGSQNELQLEKSSIVFESNNDFNDRYIFRIIDNTTNTYRDIEMMVPFSVSGTNLDFIYSYDSVGLTVNITDRNSEDVYTETINYIF